MTSEVTQEAREVAAEVVYDHMRGGLLWHSARETRDRILRGEWDNNSTVQAFARFERETIARIAHRGGDVVAWMYHWPEDAGRTPFFGTKQMPATANGWQNGWTETPLYAAPPTDEVARLREAIAKALDAPMLDHSQRGRDIYSILRQALGEQP